MMSPRWVGASLVVVLAVAGWLFSDRAASDTVADFAARHWRQPLAPQGPPPAHLSPLERSLAAASCGSCHPAQLADWRTSFHARAMGPGVTGQLVEMRRSDPDTARLCLTCHAPLAEQAPGSPDHDARLAADGIVCAACHVRHHQRFGPPRRDGSTANSTPSPLPHDGAVRTPAFRASEFCAACHQFEPDGFALNGKLLENTYAEWRQSAAARRGEQCQHCHMPDRRHLWRGIHDPEMARSAIDVVFTAEPLKHHGRREIVARLAVGNTGAGHYFPTYVTPRVLVRLALLDRSGQEIPGSVDEHVIAREITLDLSREIRDTRIPPGGTVTFAYRRVLEPAAAALAATVRIEPDHFYTKFFESLLAAGAGAGERQIRVALDASRRSSFEVFSRRLPLT
jgi:hypothetical protein